jgi:hypothetical protein
MNVICKTTATGIECAGAKLPFHPKIGSVIPHFAQSRASNGAAFLKQNHSRFQTRPLRIKNRPVANNERSHQLEQPDFFAQAVLCRGRPARLA